MHLPWHDDDLAGKVAVYLPHEFTVYLPHKFAVYLYYCLVCLRAYGVGLLVLFDQKATGLMQLICNFT